MLSLSTGTFRPDRIRAIADRFGVDGNMALENILYGQLGVIGYFPCMTFISPSVQQRTSGKKIVITYLLYKLTNWKMELINECSLRFAEDKDFRLLVCLPRFHSFKLLSAFCVADRRQHYGFIPC